MKIRKWIVALAVIVIASGSYWYSQNHLSESEIAENVQTGLQHQLDTDETFKKVQMHVGHVSVLHEDGNKYQAIASVQMGSTTHDVPVHVLVDGRKIAWQTDNGAFMFAAQEMMRQTMSDFQLQLGKATAAMAKPAPAPDESPMPADVKAMADQWQSLDDKCRGGSGDDPSTSRACDQRESIYTKIRQANWCWGHAADIDADRKWVACAPGDS